MKRESFEDQEVAEMMNQTFVSIKVDKEERPDINSVYMDVSRRMTGGGGWPLTVIMTPDKIPFFVATYIPKRGRRGIDGLLELIPKVKRLWKNDRERLIERGNSIIENVKNEISGPSIEIDRSIFDDAFNYLSNSFDEKNGGFGGSPKFPTPHNLLFLLRYGKIEDDKWAIRMVNKTLDKMREGGIYDHLGYGFHRYSTDSKWILPHFEKMLYDQAMLIMAYTDAYQVSKDDGFLSTINEVITFVNRNLLSEEGGYYSSEDAEAGEKEGGYYTWTEREIQNILGDNYRLFIEFFNIDEDGNFKDEATGQKTGENVLYIDKDLEKFAKNNDKPIKELKDKIEGMKRTLFQERLRRERPNVDNKILTDWNSLMIVALIKAGFVLGEEEYLDMAERSINFILNKMVEDDEIYHSYIEDEVTVEGLLDDYSFLIWALLVLYQTTFKIRYLNKAMDLMSKMMDKFWDDEKGGFFLSFKDSEELPFKNKEVYDGAYPSGNSIAFLDLVYLSRITGRERYGELIDKMIDSFSGNISKNPAQYTMFLTALQFWWSESKEIVFVGNREEDEIIRMLNVLRNNFIPNKALIMKDENNKQELKDIVEFTSTMEKIDGKPTAYICENFSCKEPITDTEKFKSVLLGKD